jgi:glycosyltransferase involved in cell wall biosynthesis
MFAKALAARGHEVEVLTGFPNYPSGKLYPGYHLRLWRREEMDGIRVNRVVLYPSHDKSSTKRIANYVSFAISAAAPGSFLVRRPDVIYVYHPPPTIGLAALTLKIRFGTPVIYDIQDMWPDTVAATGMLSNPKTLTLIDAYCRLLYRLCDRIVVLSLGFKRILVERGVSPEKIEVIYNWTYESETQSVPDLDVTLAHELAGRFNVLFAGTIGLAQALDSVLDAARILSYKVPLVQFVFVGEGIERERLMKRVRNENLSNVRFIPRQPTEAMGPIYAAADVLLVHLRDDPLFHVTIPSKIQAYMLAGKPILNCVRGDAANMVRRAGAGTVCEPENAADIARGVEALASRPVAELRVMGTRGKEFYNRELSIKVGVERFEKVFREAIK